MNPTPVKIASLLILGILASCSGLSAQVLTIGLNIDSGSYTLKNSDNLTPLSGGLSSVVGDGDVVQIGYYTAATSGNLFAGTWVPLTGNGGANSDFAATSIGDNPDAGAGDGSFAFAAGGTTAGDIYLNFVQGSSTAGVMPGDGQLMAVRFYNGTTVASSTAYGVASDAAWAWMAPTSAPQNMNFSLDDPSVAWFNNQIGYTGTALAVPEPSVSALFALGLLISLGYLLVTPGKRRAPARRA